MRAQRDIRVRCHGDVRKAGNIRDRHVLKRKPGVVSQALLQDLERTVQEGNYHNGLSSVTQFIARKPS